MSEQREWKDLAIAISIVCGWIYVIAWSLSFYPQPWLNIRRRSTVGLTVDFPLLNVLGFVCYATSTGMFLLNNTVRRQYADRNPQVPVPTVRINDFVFALHALVMCIITYSQFWSKLWGFRAIPGKRASRITQGVFCGAIASIIVIALVVSFAGPSMTEGDSWAMIDVVYAASYVKLIVTCVKYIPQVMSNYRAQSTAGWSIHQILLDLIGGVLSITQLVIDSALESDWSGVTGNAAKFGLGNISIFFDIIFITQHYVLYAESGPETQTLLGSPNR